MKIVIIQSANNGFFPRFYLSLYKAIYNTGNESILLQPRNGSNLKTHLPNQVLFGSKLNWFIHYNLYKITGLQDIWSFFETSTMILKLFKIKPDIIHLHVVNDCNLNFPLLVLFTRLKKIPVLWTMHDCRAFTGGCSYFEENNCNKWIKGCNKCQLKTSLLDNTNLQWEIRKRLFNNFHSLNIVTPSIWLSNYVKRSFLSKNPCNVIYNGIDLEIFRKDYKDTWLDKYNIRNKTIILGVAGYWEKRKGFNYFVQLAKELPKTFQIVLVGDIPCISESIINIPQTKDTCFLASLYQHSTIFCNPTLADNFPTTNIEALASGTPIITFETGGSPEAIDSTCGITVKKGDYKALKESIIYMKNNIDKYSKENCINRAKLFSNKQYYKYVELYQSIIKMK